MTSMETAVVFSVKERIGYSKNSIVSQQLTKSKLGNVTLFAFDKDQQLSEHSVPFDAIVQVLDGTVEITIAGGSHEVNAGEMIIMPANIPHAVFAVTAFKMILTMIRVNKDEQS